MQIVEFVDHVDYIDNIDYVVHVDHVVDHVDKVDYMDEKKSGEGNQKNTWTGKKILDLWRNMEKYLVSGGENPQICSRGQ